MKVMKRFFALLLVTSVFLLVACSKTVEHYFATDEPNQDSSWVSYVTVEKTNGKITDAHWSAYNIEGDTNTTYQGLDKYSASEQHIYNMNSELWWHEQADLLVAKLIETQSYNEQEPLPAGVSIVVDEFYTLVEKAIAAGPVAKGDYQDGYHFISEKANGSASTGGTFYFQETSELIKVDDFTGYTFASVVVVNGRIVMVYFNAAYSKFRLLLGANNQVQRESVDGTNYAIIDPNHRVNRTTGAPNPYLTKNQLGYSYAMKTPNGPGAFEYFEAAKAAGEHVVTNQGWVAELTDGNTDAVAGVTITATDFKTIADRIPKA